MLHKNNKITLVILSILLHSFYALPQYSRNNTGILKKRIIIKQDKENLQNLFDTIGATSQQEALQKLSEINNLFSSTGAQSIEDVISSTQQLKKNLKETETQLSLYKQKTSDQKITENDLQEKITLLCSALDVNNIEDATQKIENMKTEFKKLQSWKKNITNTLNDLEKLNIQ